MSKADLDITLTNLRTEAIEAGLMDAGETLMYESGSRTNGIAPALYAGRRGDLATFVPRFTHKTTQREAILQMDAITYALRTLRLNPRSTP